MIEMYQLEQLLAVAERGTLSGAAEQMHLSQPSLSRSMQRLEAELQVPLFVRHKNKIELNANGQMAVEYARKILGETHDMVTHIQAFDRSQRTILAGSSAPAPLWEILPILGRLYPDMTISSELQKSEILLQGLRRGVYQLIILPYAVKEEGISCVKYGEEHLFFSLPPAHPLSGSKGLYMKDLNGETMLLLDRLGFWEDLTNEKMPDTRFLVQENAAFYELVKASALPCFATDRVLVQEGPNQSRIKVPILDPEANVTYYCLYRTEHRRLLGDFLEAIQN
ncbi:MAG TPA: LysR family transcriptional regulator [Candidatus Caccousia avistercoris]|nr:LysR family transcriptional regulator [Candidatus Caccousia avistercoris]